MKPSNLLDYLGELGEQVCWEDFYLEERALVLFLGAVANRVGRTSFRKSEIEPFLRLFVGPDESYLKRYGYDPADPGAFSSFAGATICNLLLSGVLRQEDGGDDPIYSLVVGNPGYVPAVSPEEILRFFASEEGRSMSPEAKLVWMVWTMNGGEPRDLEALECFLARVFRGVGNTETFRCEDGCVWSLAMGELVIRSCAKYHGNSGRPYLVVTTRMPVSPLEDAKKALP